MPVPQMEIKRGLLSVWVEAVIQCKNMMWCVHVQFTHQVFLFIKSWASWMEGASVNLCVPITLQVFFGGELVCVPLPLPPPSNPWSSPPPLFSWAAISVWSVQLNGNYVGSVSQCGFFAFRMHESKDSNQMHFTIPICINVLWGKGRGDDVCCQNSEDTFFRHNTQLSYPNFNCINKLWDDCQCSDALRRSQLDKDCVSSILPFPSSSPLFL
jgi:hypothetical protein